MHLNHKRIDSQAWLASEPPEACGFRLNASSFAGSIRFHPTGFTSSLTLSSKCFATFPHGTCLLSVSWGYLVLGEVYHLLWAAIPNNPTQRRINRPKSRALQVYHLLWRPGHGKLVPWDLDQANRLYATRRYAETHRFSAGLFPVHSPLLRESLLVSFPPLTDMLKFSGWSRLSSGHK